MAETQKLKVFISWAGERANAIGAGFHEFLPDVVNAVQPFMSGKSIDKGTRWSEVLNSSLQESPCAIVCLTRESVQSIWVAFEAGAISKAAGGTEGARSRIWTYLSGIEAQDLQLTPFAEYQATHATEEETFRVVESINRLSPDPVSAESLKRRFDAVFWPHFSKVLDWVRETPEVPLAATSESRPETDVLSEILKTLRSVQRDVRRSAGVSRRVVSTRAMDAAKDLSNTLAEAGIFPEIISVADFGHFELLYKGNEVILGPDDVDRLRKGDSITEHEVRKALLRGMPGEDDAPQDSPKV